MKKYFVFLALVIGLSAGAQQFELTTNGFREKNFKYSNRNIHIASFRVNYQIMYRDQDSENGGRTVGGGMKGSSKASVALGLKGPSSEDLVKTTDEIYQAFTQKLTGHGYTIVGLDKVKDFDPYEDWTKVKGGIGNESQVPGAVTVSPTGFEYMVKKVSKDGKERGLADPAIGMRMNKLSKNLGGALVVHINLTIALAKQGKDFKTGLANALGAAAVSAQTDLRITPPQFSVWCMRKMGDEGATSLSFKDDLSIPNVIESKLYKAMAVSRTDWGTSNSLYTYFSVEDVEDKYLQPIEVDPAAYCGGVKAAALSFLTKAVDEVNGYIK
ncbi:MAG: hypothetical protein ACKO3B_13595 [Bacteroidota bacterium]